MLLSVNVPPCLPNSDGGSTSAAFVTPSVPELPLPVPVANLSFPQPAIKKLPIADTITTDNNCFKSTFGINQNVLKIAFDGAILTQKCGNGNLERFGNDIICIHRSQ